MKFRTMIPIVAGFAVLAAAAPAFAEPEIRHEQVQFQKGTSGATVKGSIKGRQVIDYRVRAVAGQNMDVTLKASKTSAYFNVLATDNAPLFVGSVSGNQFSGLLPKDGEYTIRVYLMGNAASSNQSADFTLDIDITSRPASAAKGSTPRPNTMPRARSGARRTRKRSIANATSASCATSPPAAPRSGSPTAPTAGPACCIMPTRNSPPTTGQGFPPSARTTTGGSASAAGSSI